MFNFQYSQITQNESDKLAKLLLKYPTVYATSNFDVGKISSPLHLPLKPDAIFKKQRAGKVPIHLHDKVNRLHDILEQNEIISPLNKEEQPKGNTFINPVIILINTDEINTVIKPEKDDDTESTELQLNHINCESTDSKSDTNNTISVNMITVENDYEPIIYEQPFTSHIYENQLEPIQNYYTRPISNDVPVEQEVNEINTVIKPEKDEVQSSSTNHIYQNIQKE